MRLDKFIGVFRLVDKKRQETKKTYCIDKLKIKTTEKNDDCITTERPAANTRLSDNSRMSALSGFCARIRLVAVRQRIRPQPARAHIVSRSRLTPACYN